MVKSSAAYILTNFYWISLWTNDICKLQKRFVAKWVQRVHFCVLNECMACACCLQASSQCNKMRMNLNNFILFNLIRFASLSWWQSSENVYVFVCSYFFWQEIFLSLIFFVHSKSSVVTLFSLSQNVLLLSLPLPLPLPLLLPRCRLPLLNLYLHIYFANMQYGWNNSRNVSESLCSLIFEASKCAKTGCDVVDGGSQHHSTLNDLFSSPCVFN